jgi:hypothetical protein
VLYRVVVLPTLFGPCIAMISEIEFVLLAIWLFCCELSRGGDNGDEGRGRIDVIAEVRS